MDHICGLTQDSRTQLLGDAVVLIENILSSKLFQPFLSQNQKKKLIEVIKPIMKHGCVGLIDDRKCLWNVILGLRVICPHLWPTELFKPNPDEQSDALISRWLELSLECGLLSVQLEKLVAESDRVQESFSSTAFLRSHDYLQALTVALRALEKNCPASLAKINPVLMASYFGSSVPSFRLLTPSSSSSDEDKKNVDSRRAKLEADKKLVNPDDLEFSYTFTPSNEAFPISSYGSSPTADTTPSHPAHPKKSIFLSSDSEEEEEFKYIKPSEFLLSCYARMRERPPSISIPAKSRRDEWLSSTTSSSSVSDRFNSTLTKTSRNEPYIIRSIDIPGQSDAAISTVASSRGVTFMEDGGHSIMPEADGFKVLPQPGQGILEFLNFSQVVKSNGQLDRENAHFTVADAVLCAIERMKHQQKSKERRAPLSFYGESDEDLSLGTPTRGTRRKLRKASALHFAASDDPGTTDHSAFNSSSSGSECETFSPPTVSRHPGQQLCGSEDHMSQGDPTSAENVAINILQNYDVQLLPKASDLNWFVSEDDVPQKLLPLPDEVENSPSCDPTPIRGTTDWAPPRPQLILTLQKSNKRHSQLCAQSWRCSGCGLKVSEHFSTRFRFCNYLGRYFCTSCHTNRKTIIPARIIHKWDFKKYLVSNFSDQLLQCMHEDPLFNIATLNSSLYKKSRALHQIHVYRLQLFHARSYIMACNRAKREKELLERSPDHWSNDPHVYSVKDLVDASNDQLTPLIKRLTVKLITHISGCESCAGQGFICELCARNESIFPFQLDVVTQCTKCKSCYHFLCFSPHNECPRCARKEKRLREAKNVICSP